METIHDTVPMHWATAGGLIGLLTLALLFLANRRLGMSTGFEALCSLGIKAPYFQRPALTASTGWRLPIVVGLILGGLLSVLSDGGLAPTWELGERGESLGLSHSGRSVWMFVGGIFIGFGTRLGGGCTSGHGIFGVSNFERSGWTTMACFMGAGVITSHVIFGTLSH